MKKFLDSIKKSLRLLGLSTNYKFYIPEEFEDLYLYLDDEICIED